MRRHIAVVSVGVDRVPGMAVLSGACKDARAVCEWFEGQQDFDGVSVETHLFTDERGTPVQVGPIRTVIADVLDRGAASLLVIYLSGHAILKTPGDEQFLLSLVMEDDSEAISIGRTVNNAPYCGVRHVVVITDACRKQAGAFTRFGAIDGKPLIANPSQPDRTTKVDFFFATQAQSAAIEINGEGIFTRVLLESLNEPGPRLRTRVVIDDEKFLVIQADKLETLLRSSVRTAYADAGVSGSRRPEIETTSREPLFVALVSPQIDQVESQSARDASPLISERRPAPLARRDRMNTVRIAPKKLDAANAISRDPSVARLVDEVMQALHKAVAERSGSGVEEHWGLDQRARTRLCRATPEVTSALLSMHSDATDDSLIRSADVVVFGAKVKLLAHADVHELASERTVRSGSLFAVSDARGAKVKGSALVMTDSSTLSVVPLLPGFTARLWFERGLLQSLSYEPRALLSPGARATKERTIATYLVSARRAANAIARLGKLRMLGQQNAAALWHAALQSRPQADPLLALAGSYGFALQGNNDVVIAIANHMGRRVPSANVPSSPLLFDVAMLSRLVTPTFAAQAPGLASFCPMLSLGWTLIEEYVDAALHPAVGAVGRHRLPATWTTFPVSAAADLIEAFRKREIL